MSDNPSLAQQIDQHMRDLPFDFDEAKMLLHFAQGAVNGVSPADTARDLTDRYMEWERVQDGPEILKNSHSVRLPYSTSEISYSIGKTDAGFHYQISEWGADATWDRQTPWSQAYRTEEDAEIRAKQAIRDEIGRAVPPQEQQHSIMVGHDYGHDR